jgi:acetoin utilization deacetylase AcuC-like enzyme
VSESLTSIPVFYSESMLAETDSFSPSAGKPRDVVGAWRLTGLPIAVNAFTPASQVDLCLAHDPAYVRGILSGELVNGFGDISLEVARSLPFTSGAMMAAASAALEMGCACAPVSGFHHAGYDSASGYCTFNGLMVTAESLLRSCSVRRVLILDCDMHYGDGTDAILTRLGRDGAIENATFGRWFHQPRQASAYLARLRETVARFGEFDLVLYQAGADVHVDDPLGGVLSTDEMIERDRVVFEAARAFETPITWNLAGGYQEPLAKVVALHVNTMRECARVFARAADGASTGSHQDGSGEVT